MKFRRTSRIVAAVVALFSMLFMQLAVASYACPTAGNPVATGAQCAGMDPAQPSLCKAKASNLAAKQSLDKPDLPPVLPFIAADLAGTVVADAWALESSEGAAAPPDMTRSLSPPHSIEHCCFRH
ncbi:hypothetical protein [Pseudoduganella sp. R-34]|uniref:hypothetical protein n=1 Tax=unclassified Pseudoduganella TaxID=2637179 RepID=UPI003CEC9FF6